MTALTLLAGKELYDETAPAKGTFVTHAETVADLSALNLDAITTIGNSATGTEIATAVNALISALQAAKITL